MNRISNKRRSLLLLLPALAPVIYYSFFILSQFALRIEMKKELNRKELISIHISPNTPVHGNEIYVDGKLFDIKNKQVLPNGGLIVTGLFDEEESLLNEGLSENQEKDSSKSQLTKVIFQWQGFPPVTAEYYYQAIPLTFQAPADQPVPCGPPSSILIPPPQTC